MSSGLVLKEGRAQFNEATLKRVRETLKEFHRKMKKIGLHPHYDVRGDGIVILIDLDEFIRIIRNVVEGAVKGYVKHYVRREGQYMVVGFEP